MRLPLGSLFFFMNRYFIIYKPYGVLSQFSPNEGKLGLGSIYQFPKDVYPVGRLDEDSEGLLLLTNDPKLNKLILAPTVGKKSKTYWCEVEGIPSQKSLMMLRHGVSLNIKGRRFVTSPALAKILEPKPTLPPRHYPVNYSKASEHSWIEITITQGKNRQVRKMTAAIGHPTLRLIRIAIENLRLPSFEPGLVHEKSQEEVYHLLNLKNVAT